jgi:hypothetical protein
MKSEYTVFEGVERAPCNQAEIRHVFLVFYPPCLAIFFAVDVFESCLADMLLLGRAIPESPVAGAEDRSENTITRYLRPCGAAPAQSEPAALRAALFCQSEYFRGVPIEIHEIAPPGTLKFRVPNM